MRHRSPVRKGVSLVEVMLAIGVVLVAFLAMLGAGNALHRQGHLTEAHLVAGARLRCLFSVAAALDFQLLDWAARNSPGGEASIDLESVLGPAYAALLMGPTGPPAAPTGKPEATLSLPEIRYQVTYIRRGADLGELRAQASWNQRALNGPERVQELRLSRLVHRPCVSFAVPSEVP